MPKPLMDGLPAGEESKFTSTPVSVLHDVGVAAVGRRLGCCTHSHRSPVIPKGYIGFGQSRVHNLLFSQQKERSPASFLQHHGCMPKRLQCRARPGYSQSYPQAFAVVLSTFFGAAKAT